MQRKNSSSTAVQDVIAPQIMGLIMMALFLHKKHWTKKWIYIKFAQHKDVANICLLLSKSVADMVNATFAAIFTLVRKYGSKCGIYHLCPRFSLELIYVRNIL